MSQIDARGKSCPMPIVLLAKAARELPPGGSISILSDDRAFPMDVEAWCLKTKHKLVSLKDGGGSYEAVVLRP